jgi:DICT domain-containing protein
MTTYVYVLTKDKGVYGVFPTEQAAKDKVVQIITSNWYAYGDLMLNVAAAKYQISRQMMAEGVTDHDADPNADDDGHRQWGHAVSHDR